jgi:hypothetical protein
MLSTGAAVRALFAEALDELELDDINLPRIADDIVEQVKQDPELVAAFLEEHLRPMVYQIGYALLSTQRVNRQRVETVSRVVQAIVLPATVPPTRRAGRLLAPRPRERSGFEWLRLPLSIANGRHVRLERARRHELDLAIERADARLLPARQRAMHYRLIREALPDDDQRVGDVLTDGDVAALWQRAQDRVAAEVRGNTLAQQALAAPRSQPALPQP